MAQRVTGRRVLDDLGLEQESEVPGYFGLDTDYEPDAPEEPGEMAKRHISALKSHDDRDYSAAFRAFSDVNDAVHNRPEVEPVDAAAMRTLAFLSHDVAEDGRGNVYDRLELPGREFFRAFEGEEWGLVRYFSAKEGDAIDAGETGMDGFRHLPEEYGQAETDFYRTHGDINGKELDPDEVSQKEKEMWYAIHRSLELRFPNMGLGSVGEATQSYFDAVRKGHDQGDREAAAKHLQDFYETLTG